MSGGLGHETYLIAMLTTISTAPGDWMTIMGMLSAPTSLRRNV